MRRALVVILLILVAVFVALGACGKKGPPFLSERITPVYPSQDFYGRCAGVWEI